VFAITFMVSRKQLSVFTSVGCAIVKTILALCLGSMGTANAQNVIKLSSVAELRSAMEKSDQLVVMQPGKYEVGSQTFRLSGNNNTIELKGAHFSWVVGEAGRGRMSITGHGNTIRNGEFEDVYYNGIAEVTDFTAYNQDRDRLANGGGSNISITGDNNRLVGFKMTVRGSYPYGYGAMFGIGKYRSFKLDKHGGIVIKAKNTVLDRVEVQQQAFCHAIFMQSPADNTVIKNCLVEGAVRPTDDMYKETDPQSLPYRYNYRMPFSIVGERNRRDVPIPRDHMFTITEDGIRVYKGGGSVRVENTTVKKTRGGIRLYLGSGATVTNCTAIDCGSTNFNLPKGGTITGSIANFAYGPLSDFRLGRSKQNIDMTILPSPNAMGDHNIADVQGDGHAIVFRRTPGPIDTTTRSIVVTGSNSTIRNETEYSIILASSSNGNTIVSRGKVTNNGKNNKVNVKEIHDESI
jgi:parallel beta-helix repeat protein